MKIYLDINLPNVWIAYAFAGKTAALGAVGDEKYCKAMEEYNPDLFQAMKLDDIVDPELRIQTLAEVFDMLARHAHESTREGKSFDFGEGVTDAF